MLKTGVGLTTTNIKLHIKYDSPQLLDWPLRIFECSLWRKPKREKSGMEGGGVLTKQRALDSYDNITMEKPAGKYTRTIFSAPCWEY